jgi:hypothetical protein
MLSVTVELSGLVGCKVPHDMRPHRFLVRKAQASVGITFIRLAITNRCVGM